MKHILSILLLGIANQAFAIEKCQDADGNWHYGDIAVEGCEASKITTLSDRGFVTNEEEAPKTEQELAAMEVSVRKEEEEKNRLQAEAEERRRVLGIYETEADIDRQRDNQIDSVQRNMDVYIAYLKGMDKRRIRNEAKLEELQSKPAKDKLSKEIAAAKLRVKDSRTQLGKLMLQKEQIIAKFQKEKEIYLTYKNRR